MAADGAAGPPEGAAPPTPPSPAPYSTYPNAATPADAEAVAEAIIGSTPSGPDSQVVVVPLDTRVSGTTNLSVGTNISVPTGWHLYPDVGLEQVDSCTSALLRAGVMPYDIGMVWPRPPMPAMPRPGNCYPPACM